MNIIQKIFISILLILSLSYSVNNIVSACEYSDAVGLKNSLDNCFLDTDVVSPPGDLEVSSGGGFNEFLLLWIDSIAGVLAVAAVGMIAYGSLMFVLSTGEDEKITKGKDIIKWGIIGFIGVITANALIELIINILYDI